MYEELPHHYSAETPHLQVYDHLFPNSTYKAAAMIPATIAARPNSSLPAPLLLGARVEVAAGELETGGLGVPVAAGTVLFPLWLLEPEPVPVGYMGVTCEAP